MRKQAAENNQKSAIFSAGKDTTSRVLLIAAIILYSVSLILLANMAIAGTSSKVGALIKVNNQLDGDAFADLNVDVRSVAGNVMAIDLPRSSVLIMNSVRGLCNSQLDHQNNRDLNLNAKQIKAKYAGAGVVVGILDNTGTLNPNAASELKKVENSSNVGFISYVSDNPNSTVIMHNIKSGESNLIQALLYMIAYAKTVGKSLVVELNVGVEEMNNPLFVQVCQKYADAGIQFIGADISNGYSESDAPVQLAFSTFNSETGQITDQTDFWAIEEVKQQQLMLLGSDERLCSIYFRTEEDFDKVYLSNSSKDLVMVTTIAADGSVNYYHVTNKETALIPRNLRNGTPILEDGLTGVFPYHSKGVLFNGAVASNQFVTLKNSKNQVRLNAKNGLSMMVGSSEDRTLAMSLENISPNLKIEVTNATGQTVYRSQPDKDVQSIKTRIDLSSGEGDLYFLSLISPDFHQTFALKVD